MSDVVLHRFNLHFQGQALSYYSFVIKILQRSLLPMFIISANWRLAASLAKPDGDSKDIKYPSEMTRRKSTATKVLPDGMCCADDGVCVSKSRRKQGPYDKAQMGTVVPKVLGRQFNWLEQKIHTATVGGGEAGELPASQANFEPREVLIGRFAADSNDGVGVDGTSAEIAAAGADLNAPSSSNYPALLAPGCLSHQPRPSSSVTSARCRPKNSCKGIARRRRRAAVQSEQPPSTVDDGRRLLSTNTSFENSDDESGRPSSTTRTDEYGRTTTTGCLAGWDVAADNDDEASALVAIMMSDEVSDEMSDEVSDALSESFSKTLCLGDDSSASNAATTIDLSRFSELFGIFQTSTATAAAKQNLETMTASTVLEFLLRSTTTTTTMTLTQPFLTSSSSSLGEPTVADSTLPARASITMSEILKLSAILSEIPDAAEADDYDYAAATHETTSDCCSTTMTSDVPTTMTSDMLGDATSNVSSTMTTSDVMLTDASDYLPSATSAHYAEVYSIESGEHTVWRMFDHDESLTSSSSVREAATSAVEPSSIPAYVTYRPDEDVSNSISSSYSSINIPPVMSSSFSDREFISAKNNDSRTFGRSLANPPPTTSRFPTGSRPISADEQVDRLGAADGSQMTTTMKLDAAAFTFVRRNAGNVLKGGDYRSRPVLVEAVEKKVTISQRNKIRSVTRTASDVEDEVQLPDERLGAENTAAVPAARSCYSKASTFVASSSSSSATSFVHNQKCYAEQPDEELVRCRRQSYIGDSSPQQYIGAGCTTSVDEKVLDRRHSRTTDDKEKLNSILKEFSFSDVESDDDSEYVLHIDEEALSLDEDISANAGGTMSDTGSRSYGGRDSCLPSSEVSTESNKQTTTARGELGEASERPNASMPTTTYLEFRTRKLRFAFERSSKISFECA